MRKFLFVFTIILVFTGCIAYKKDNDFTKRSTNFSLLVNKLSKTICSSIDKNSILYVTDFVNETNLKNISQLGFLLSNELKVDILRKSCAKNVSLKEFQLAKNLQIGKQGSRVLTRDLNKIKIKNLQDDKQILVGSYMLTKKQLIVFLKLINLKSGNSVSSSSVSTPLTQEIQELEGINTTKKINTIIYKPFHL
jgi:hypothetical protein